VNAYQRIVDFEFIPHPKKNEEGIPSLIMYLLKCFCFFQRTLLICGF